MITCSMRLWLLAGLCLALFASAPAFAAETTTNKPAVVKISGLGLFGNREMLRLLRSFQVRRERLTTIDRAFVEDAALVLLSRVENEGYLNAKLQARFTLADGGKQTLEWTNAMEVVLPRDFAARQVNFRMRRGVRFYYRTLEITGVKVLSETEAKRFFVGTEMLFNLRANRVYSPSQLKASVSALREELTRKGYRDVVVTVSEVQQDRKSGAVRVAVQVDEGLQSRVRSVNVEVYVPGKQTPEKQETRHPAKAYSPLWQQDFALRLREEQYARGHPDATAEISVTRRETNGPTIQVDMRARVNTGPLVRLGEVHFEGERATKPSILERRLSELKPGEPLSRLDAEKARQRLARLGIFDWVGLRYEPKEEGTRDVVYELKESKAIGLNILAGYGSYEMLRGGLEFEDRNLFGLAHNLRVRGLQSFKGTSGEMIYTVPGVFSDDVNLVGRGSGLSREEETFTRQEYGGAIGLQTHIVPIHTDFSARYDYQFLNALDLGAVDPSRVGATNARAAAFIIDLTRDRRDNPLVPRRGLKLTANLEVASEALGGNVDYQRFVFGASYHVGLGGGRYAHFGVAHGLTFVLGGDVNDLPFNKRFFPGGENSVRGYQEGKASPLDASGNQLGAETFTQGNVEFEQLLTRSWSLVAFVDAVGFARDRADYPVSEALYSVGGGLRWRTIIGPVRVEYGYNLHRREHDPAGTLHVSIGYPF